MKLLKLEIHDGFRSLQKDFAINFHSLDDSEPMEQFRPFCFAGLNGSGKSNVLEALANIFYHLEICVARYLPDSIKDPKNFKRNECNPNSFVLEYLIGQHNERPYALRYFHKVTIRKKEGKEPVMTIKEYPFDNSNKEIEISLIVTSGTEQSAPGKRYLPDHVIGYSSGENEILSLPFIKSRLVHLDEYLQYSEVGAKEFSDSENSLIYIDNQMSQAVLLTCLLFEDEETLAPLKDVDNTGVLGLRSFRINLNHLSYQSSKDSEKGFNRRILDLLSENQIKKLKSCATTWFDNGESLSLDFFVNSSTREAFRYHFKDNGLECFQLFRLLYELNFHFVSERDKEAIYQSKGVYTDWKLPVGTPNQDVFHFLHYYVIKKQKITGKEIDLLLRSFSDGEHQFLHTIGICLLLKDKRALLLLDEPETHFNPSWRAKFIKVLNDSITASGKSKNRGYNVHLLKDVLLTSHSPFIISDCLPDNVVLFEKDSQGNTTAKKASELGIDTYGTSVNLLTNRIFKSKETIGKYAIQKLNEFKTRFSSNERTEDLIEELNREFGDSIEKLMLIKEMTDNREKSA